VRNTQKDSKLATIWAGALVMCCCPAMKANTIIQSFMLPGSGDAAPTNWTASNTTDILQYNGPTQLEAIRLTVHGIGYFQDTITDTNASASCGGANQPPAGPDCGNDSIPLYMVADFHLKLGDSSLGGSAGFPLLDIQETAETVNYTGLSYGDVVHATATLEGTSTAVYDVTGGSGNCANPGPGCLETGYTAISNNIFSILNGAPVDPLNLSWFEGNGVVPLTIRAFVSKQITNGGGDQEIFSGLALAQVTVEYDVADTPEPSAWILLGSAFGALGILSRRGDKRKLSAGTV